jgi:hypothetical protein
MQFVHCSVHLVAPLPERGMHLLPKPLQLASTFA